MNINLTKRKIVSSILGVIYEMAPNNSPRNVDKIHKYLIDYCDKNIKDYETSVEDKNLRKYLHDMLYACKEFTDLNISQSKWDRGIRDYNTPANSGYGVVAVGHNENGVPVTISKPNWYTDFIDLDACVGNIASEIIGNEKLSEDCFLCKFATKYGSMTPSDCDECKTCILNPKYDFNRVPHPKSLLPRNSEEYKNYKE